MADDFAIRLERIIGALESELDRLARSDLSVEQFRELVGQKLHGDLLPNMRSALRRSLPEQGTVVILIDNLDKSWEREIDLAELAEFLLGALRGATKLANELQDAAAGLRKTRSKIVVFLRADIYDRIRRVSREPDKLRANWLEWNDRDLLFRVLEERMVASQSDDSDPGELLDRFFCDHVDGERTRDYLVAQALPKPRDLLFLTKAAVAEAINRAHGKVEAVDIKKASARYAEFAYEVLRIEDASSELPIADSLIELAGGPSVLDESALLAALARGLVSASTAPDLREAIRRLVLLGFLEVEVSQGDFRAAERELELDKVLTMARRYGETRSGEVRYRVHRAYRAYLELGNDPSEPERNLVLPGVQ